MGAADLSVVLPDGTNHEMSLKVSAASASGQDDGVTVCAVYPYRVGIDIPCFNESHATNTNNVDAR